MSFPAAPSPSIARQARLGMTLVQLLVVMAILAVVLAILFPTIGRIRAASQSTKCLNNLRNLTVAFRLYANDHENLLPNPGVSQIPWERSLARYCDITIFICPADEELAPFTNSSYDWRDNGLEDATLAGKPLNTARGDTVLVFDALPGWHAVDKINVARVDGSALALPTDDGVTELSRPIKRPPNPPGKGKPSP